MMPPVRRSLAVLIAALLAGVFAVAGISAPADAAPKDSLKIVSVTNADKPRSWTTCSKRTGHSTWQSRFSTLPGSRRRVSKATTIILERLTAQAI